MKTSVLGPGDISKVKLPKNKALKLIDDIGKVLAEKKSEVFALPSRGVPLEIAKAYKKHGGKKFIGVVPSKDRRYGIKHIKKYFGKEDKKLNIGSWYDLNGEIASLGDYCVVFGISPGVMAEICMMKYHYKFFNSKTKLIIFKNSISAPMQKEITADLKKIYYISTIQQLKKILQ